MPGKDGIFKASRLERAIKDVIEAKLGVGHKEEMMFEAAHAGRIYKT